MYLLFDIGGSNTRITVSKDGKSFEEPHILDTPKHDFDEGIKVIEKYVDSVTNGERIQAVAGGIAGPLDERKSMLVNSPHIADWNRKPLQTELERITQAPVYLENDAALAGLGEATHGAGRNKDIVVYMTISTGVGGARIVKEKIDVSTMGFEPGHQIIDPTGDLCRVCGGKGELEERISGTSVALRYGKHPSEITDDSVWDELEKWTALGLANTLVHWSPDIVVLGGSMVVKSPGIRVEKVREYLPDMLTIFPEPPEVAKAELKDFGALYGGLSLLGYKT